MNALTGTQTMSDGDWRTRMESNLEELARVTLGTRATELEGGGRHHDGVVHNIGRLSERLDQVAADVADIKRKIGNGGIRVKLSGPQWAAITALITLVTVILAAVTRVPVTP